MEQKATTYTALKSQIAKLQADADQILKTERVAVIDRIKEAVSVYGLTAKDLGLGKQLRRPRMKRKPEGTAPGALPKTPREPRKPRPAKFSDGKGNEWNGRGEQPEWIKAAIASGHTLNEFKRKPAK
jgi:DNA-binding protein H-NS